MNGWKRGEDSAVYRFEKRREEALTRVVEVEVYDHGEADVRLLNEPNTDGGEMTEEVRCDSLADALNYAREQWGLEADALPDSPTVRVKRLALSMLADYVGTDAVFGHDVPAETRDALAAAYEALDEPGLPITFHDCPSDGVALDQLPDDPDLPPHVERLECPECGTVYVLDHDTGKLETDAAI